MEKHQIKLTSRYMILPVSTNVKRKKLCFYEKNTLLWDVDAPIDFLSPQYYTYLDISHLMGKTVTITCDPKIDIDFDFCDDIPADAGANEPYRPMVHFTARYGWLNDPNGLVYANGLYHMFFQHNPTDSNWGNMTWGHAISKDLVHWEQLDSALIPDERGTIFSGSGIVDVKNVSGLGSLENPPVLFYYTAAGGQSLLSEKKQFTQCMAYSLDGGMTLHKYEGNPVIDWIFGDNRDPKVVYCKEMDCYILALYIKEDEYVLFTSDDLKSFKELQKIHLRGDAECPDIYPIEVENEKGVHKWILSGASDYYIVGDFSGGKFKESQASKRYSYNNNNKSYAAQTFSNVEGRRIKIAWDRFNFPNSSFNSQMSVPTEVSLCRVGNEYRLRTWPCREFESLREKSKSYLVNSCDFELALQKKAYDIEITLDRNSPDVALKFFGYEFIIRPSKNTLLIDRDEMPLVCLGDTLNLRIISDTLGCEMFADNGLIHSVHEGVADYNIRYMTVTPIDATQTPNMKLTVHELESI